MNQTGEKSNFRPKFSPFGANLSQCFLSWFLPLLDVRICCKLSLYSIWRKNCDPNSIKWQKTSFWGWLRPFGPKFRPPNIFFKNLATPVTRCHGQLPSCTISGKTYDPILRKLSDGRTDRQTDRRTDWQTRVISKDAVRLTSSVQ